MVVIEEDNAKAKAMRIGDDVVVLKPITDESILGKINDMLLQTESLLDRKWAKFQ